MLALLAFFAVAAVVLGGYLWWRHYQTTPAYSLAVMIDAAQRGDMTDLGKHLDDEAIVKNMAATVSEKAAARYGLQLSPTLKQQIDGMVPTLLPRFRQTIHDEIVREIKTLAAQSQPRPFLIVALAIPSFVTITNESDGNAKASATVGNRTVEMAMRRDGDRWKVTDFKDDVVIQRAVDSLMNDLPAIGGIELPFQKRSGRRSSRSR